MKRIFLLFITMLLFLIASCNSDFFSSGKFSDDRLNNYNPSPVIPPAGEKATPNPDPKPDPNNLKYGEWSDINDYTFYLNLFKTTPTRNCFADYINYFGFETRYMVTVNVITYGGNPIGDALVELEQSGGDLITAKTNVKGNAYLFPSNDVTGERINIKVNGVEKTLVYDGDTIHIMLDNDAEKISTLDLMFVIDATSSMGDELRYLKYNITGIINNIKTANSKYILRLALLFYRDTGDEYVTRYFDFVEVYSPHKQNPDEQEQNLKQQQKNIDKQSASGGGDFPEAADRALAESVDKDWTVDNAMRLIFHVCDAPPHSDQISQTTYYNAVKTAAEKGIRIIPVASNGIDLAAEYLLRQEAIMTGGTYIFLTGNSGSDLLNTVGAYTEDLLKDCIVRVVNNYLTGN